MNSPSFEMAEEIAKKIEEQLNCLVCLGTYTVPKLLQCNHVFCRDSLVPSPSFFARREEARGALRESLDSRLLQGWRQLLKSGGA